MSSMMGGKSHMTHRVHRAPHDRSPCHLRHALRCGEPVQDHSKAIRTGHPVTVDCGRSDYAENIRTLFDRPQTPAGPCTFRNRTLPFLNDADARHDETTTDRTHSNASNPSEPPTIIETRCCTSIRRVLRRSHHCIHFAAFSTRAFLPVIEPLMAHHRGHTVNHKVA